MLCGKTKVGSGIQATSPILTPTYRVKSDICCDGAVWDPLPSARTGELKGQVPFRAEVLAVVEAINNDLFPVWRPLSTVLGIQVGPLVGSKLHSVSSIFCRGYFSYGNIVQLSVHLVLHEPPTLR